MREELVRLDMAETFLNKDAAAACSSCAESFARGHSILTLRHLASAEEVAVLKAEAIGAAHARVVEASSEASVRELERRIVAMRAAYIKADQPWRTSTPLVSHGGAAASRHRMQIEHSLTAPGQALCDALLLRALSLLEAQLVHDLFGDCTTDSDTCVHNPQLAFSTNEPAINVYYSGGHFKPHEDNHALTILVPLSAASADFEGGGTAFWSTRDAGPGGSINARTMGAPTMVLRPPAGAALLWGGACTHGMRTMYAACALCYVLPCICSGSVTHARPYATWLSPLVRLGRPVVRFNPSGSVTHAGLPVKSGRRCVLVASFSPRTSADGPARRVPTSISAATHSAIQTGEAEAHHCVPSTTEVGSVGVSAPACIAAGQTATASHRRLAEIMLGR